MSKFLFGLHTGTMSVGFEDAEIESAMSEEEQVLSVHESTADQAEIESDLATVERLEEQASGLEDLASAADQVQEASEQEVLLTDVAAELATVGTDADMEVFEVPEGEQPSMENFVGRRISTEGIKDMAKKFWEAIKNLISRIWENLIKFYRRITDQVPGVVKQAKKLAARADTKRGAERKEDKTILGSEGRALIVDDKAPASFTDVMAGLGNLEAEAKFFLTSWANDVQDMGKSVGSAISDFNMEKAEDSLRKVNTAAKKHMTKVVSHLSTHTGGDKRFGNSKVSVSKPLPGNRSVFAATPSTDDSKSALGASAEIRGSSLSVMATNEKPKDAPKEISVSTFTPTECDKLADKVIDICGLVKEFNEKHRRNLEKSRDTIRSASDKATSKADDDTSQVVLKHYQSAVSYNTAYAKWASAPFTQLTSLALTGCRAAIAASNKSLSNYA